MRRVLAVFVLTALLCFGYVNTVLATPSVNTDPFAQACSGTGTNVDSDLCKEAQNKQSQQDNSIFGKNGIITKGTNLVSMVVGIAAVVAIIIGGLRYVLSSGDPANITGAKNMIIYAIVGLIVALTAQGIVIFVINKL